jgi:hypothetical protein
MMEDRTDRYVITVDPAGCMDADDAMGAVAWEDGESVLGTIISTYITHVPHTLERLGAWENFSPTVPFRVATTYLPNNNNLPMLPRILSEGECSLMDGNVCSCLAMDQYVTPEGKVARVEFVECVVRITENYAYESPEMLSDPVYRMIGDLVRRINELGGMRLVDAVNDSHDVVEWLMLRMNCEAGKRLYEAKRGIFRSVVVGAGESTIPPHIARKARKFMAQYRNTTASYELAEDDRGHGLVGDGGDGALITHYAQITSPIRRFVDLINMTVLCEVLRGGVDEKSHPHPHPHPHSHSIPFLTKTFIEHLNVQMRGIRRVQNDVALVAFGVENEGVVVDGVVVDVVGAVDGSESSVLTNHVSVFVEKIGGGKSFMVPVRSDLMVRVGDVLKLKVVALPSKSSAYQKTQLSVM